MALLPAVPRFSKKPELVEPAVAGRRRLKKTTSWSVLLKKRRLPQAQQGLDTVVGEMQRPSKRDPQGKTVDTSRLLHAAGLKMQQESTTR